MFYVPNCPAIGVESTVNAQPICIDQRPVNDNGTASGRSGTRTTDEYRIRPASQSGGVGGA